MDKACIIANAFAIKEIADGKSKKLVADEHGIAILILDV